MKKATRIAYNPYENEIQFEIALSTEGPWMDLAENSALLQYTNKKVLFANCVKDIVEEIQDKQNSDVEGLEIQFTGPEEDFAILKKTIEQVNKSNRKLGKLTCVFVGKYKSADKAIRIIKAGYDRIASEFEEYLPGQSKYTDGGVTIGDTIAMFNQTVSNEIPICVIGNYSVGKSALINALIGAEILPSKENPTTAKNVKVVRSESYAITFTYTDEERNYEIKLLIEDGNIAIFSSELDSEITSKICQKISMHIEAETKKSSEIIHDILDYFNGNPDDEILSHIGWNVTIEVPFAKSVLTETDAKIVFYDTPGSNNADIDQVSHKEALKVLMGEQTNALPILVSTRKTIMSDDTFKVKDLLDSYHENFSSPNCIVVISQADELTVPQLEETLPAQIKKWHGRSAILYASPIAALGERKTNGSKWLDKSYEALYEIWVAKQKNPKLKADLSQYNIIPCEDREEIDLTAYASEQLISSGIPAVEAEILYFIRDFANYKKCVRGQGSLMEAMASIKEELQKQKIRTSTAKIEAEEKRKREKEKLLLELKGIQLKDPRLLCDDIERAFSSCLDAYIASLPQILSDIYEQVKDKKAFEMDDEFNTIMKKHCQENLINPAYSGKNGIKGYILEALSESAKQYIYDLQEFVSKNNNVLSTDARQILKNYFETEVKPPMFQDVQSIIEEIAEFFEKAALLQHGFSKIVIKDSEKAKASWIEAKRKAFEKKLCSTPGLFGRANVGIFRKTAIDEPMQAYYEQLLQWMTEYRDHIEQELDQNNMILSGMEEEIKHLEEIVEDLEKRLSNVFDVDKELSAVLNVSTV